MGCKYVSILVNIRLHSSFPFVWGITSQGQMSFIGRARASGPACFKQTLLHGGCVVDRLRWLPCILLRVARWTSWASFMSSGLPLASYKTFGVYLLRVRNPPARVLQGSENVNKRLKILWAISSICYVIFRVWLTRRGSRLGSVFTDR